MCEPDALFEGYVRPSVTKRSSLMITSSTCGCLPRFRGRLMPLFDPSSKSLILTLEIVLVNLVIPRVRQFVGTVLTDFQFGATPDCGQ